MEQPLTNLKKSITFGEWVLKELANRNDLELEQKIIISLYSKFVEQTHGAYISAVNNLDSPLQIMQRSALETYLSIRFILQKEELVQKRAYSYYIGFLKNLENEVTDWCTYTEVDELITNNIDDTKQQISNVLDNPILETTLYEWNKTWRKINRRREEGKEHNPKWYSLFNGPRSINQLAEGLIKEEPSIYLFYSALSQEAHGYYSLKNTNYLTLIDEPLKLKPITDSLVPADWSPILAISTGALREIIFYLMPERTRIFLAFMKEINLDT